MSTSAIIMAVIGAVIIWGGLLVSILKAKKASK
ncbi:methionine/alanine import family NSS transporter small subunit [Gracilibacillus oryzae]|uniref:Methionine/alanine import family NSS transporter small subunit n=1 Tax=Gracilibacillus oryzae TaxID=1672701 RepID=A0A7C8GST3_9BACI|nr:methionine/alanine import family NSS transporter small subunit [Gracilibacillus oryzae]KAB8131790.1 methionine/alanine import family NSS transporter small subunit [Gracilibacillus oryzae]